MAVKSATASAGKKATQLALELIVRMVAAWA
jgi:hypothetical protein